jgi:uncharacterized protein with ParB-like and HNH nuclease domain
MKADDISIEDFLSANKTRFIIPVYQRNYDWKEKNCQQLLDDIIGLMDSNRKTLFNGFKKLFVVHIALNRRDDNPQLIFESINSTGVSLSQADLIRNFLLMDKEADKQNELFEMFWLKIEENLTSENISMFVRDYLTMKQNKIPNKDDTYETFKYFVNDQKIGTDELLTELLNFSKIYKAFLFDSDEVYSTHLKNLRQLKTSTVYPFLLPIMQEYNEGNITQKELLNTLNIIESYVVRRMVCNKPTNALNKIFASLFVEIQSSQNFSYEKFNNYFVSILLSKKGSGIFPNDEEFRGEFCSRDAYNLKNIKFILLRLENKDHNEKVDGTILSIEHVMPQTLSTTWKVKLGDKYQLVHDKYLHNIGNLSLSGDNTQLSNNSFEEKKQILNSQSSLRLNRYFLDLKII